MDGKVLFAPTVEVSMLLSSREKRRMEQRRWAATYETVSVAVTRLLYG